MTIELQSAKYFPGFFDEGNEVAIAVTDEHEATEAAPSTLEQQPTSDVASEPAQLTPPKYSKWTAAMGVVAGLMAVMGAYGIAAGLWGFLSVASLETSRAALEQMPATPELTFAKAYIDQQLQMQLFFYACTAFRALIGLEFIAAAIKMFRRSPAANEFVATVCTGAIVYHVANTSLTWLTMPSINQMGLGLDQQATEVANSLMILMLIAGAFLSSLIHFAIIVYMYGENNKNYFAK